MVERQQRGARGVDAAAVQAVADRRQRVGDHRDALAVLLDALGIRVAHQGPALDELHAREIGEEMTHGSLILLTTRLDGESRNGQPGTHAENRPAVPPATRILRLSGVRSFGVAAGVSRRVHALPQEVAHVGLRPAVGRDRRGVLGRDHQQRVPQPADRGARDGLAAAGDGGQQLRRRAAARVDHDLRRLGGEQRRRCCRWPRSRARRAAAPTGCLPRARRCSRCSDRAGRTWTC